MMRSPRRIAIIGFVAIVAVLASCAPGQLGAAGPLPTATAGVVTLRTDAVVYHPGDTITVTISNRGDQSIDYPDMRSACSDLILEQQMGDAWHYMYECKSLRHGSFLTLDPGQVSTVKFGLHSSGTPAGIYRFTLQYLPHDVVVTQATIIHSAGFQVT